MKICRPELIRSMKGRLGCRWWRCNKRTCASLSYYNYGINERLPGRVTDPLSRCSRVGSTRASDGQPVLSSCRQRESTHLAFDQCGANLPRSKGTLETDSYVSIEHAKAMETVT